jgi:hypothetical protein
MSTTIPNIIAVNAHWENPSIRPNHINIRTTQSYFCNLIVFYVISIQKEKNINIYIYEQTN